GFLIDVDCVAVLLARKHVELGKPHITAPITWPNFDGFQVGCLGCLPIVEPFMAPRELPVSFVIIRLRIQSSPEFLNGCLVLADSVIDCPETNAARCEL